MARDLDNGDVVDPEGIPPDLLATRGDATPRQRRIKTAARVLQIAAEVKDAWAQARLIDVAVSEVIGNAVEATNETALGIEEFEQVRVDLDKRLEEIVDQKIQERLDQMAMPGFQPKRKRGGQKKGPSDRDSFLKSFFEICEEIDAEDLELDEVSTPGKPFWRNKVTLPRVAFGFGRSKGWVEGRLRDLDLCQGQTSSDALKRLSEEHLERTYNQLNV